jgi:hypothetical protein
VGGDGRVIQVVEHLSSKHEAVCLNPSAAKKKNGAEIFYYRVHIIMKNLYLNIEKVKNLDLGSGEY